jgi:four helix bundle protein
MRNGKTIRPHQKLEVWKSSMDLVQMVYELTQTFPKEEMYGLTAHVRRTAISVPSNIAEGSARSSKPQLAHFLEIARGSLSELETQLLIAERLGYLPSEHTSLELLDKVSRLLTGFYRKATE